MSGVIRSSDDAPAVAPTAPSASSSSTIEVAAIGSIDIIPLLVDSKTTGTDSQRKTAYSDMAEVDFTKFKGSDKRKFNKGLDHRRSYS